MTSDPPFWLVVVVQAVSVIGDTLGQRSARLHFNGSSKRMLIVLSVVSSLQVLFFLGILQWTLPASTTGMILNGTSANGTALKSPCWKEVDFDGNWPDYCTQLNSTHNCTVVSCPSQGPWSVPRTISLHPAALLNGVQSVIYYVCEVMLYQHSLGLLLLVMAAVLSSAFTGPFEHILGFSDVALSTKVMVAGIVGPMLCVLERPVQDLEIPLTQQWRQLCTSCCQPTPYPSARRNFWSALMGYGEELDANEHLILEAKVDESVSHTMPRRGSVAQQSRNSIVVFVALIVPFLLLTAVYSTWFVSQKFFNNKFRMNVFGYTALDQVLNPVYIMPCLLLVDLPCLRNRVQHKSDRQSFGSAAKEAWSEATQNYGTGLITVFMYRLLINARAMAYFYLGVMYNMSKVYLLLQVVRVILSIVVNLLLLTACPSIIGITQDETRRALAPIHVLLKLVGLPLCFLAIVWVS